MTVPHGLRDTQEWLARCVLDETRLDLAEAAAVLCTPPGGSLATRLHAYAGGYPSRIADALRETYPAVMHLIGQTAATALTQRYITTHPPQSFNLNHAGDAWVEFLRTDELCERFPFLPDLAAFEALMMRAFHSEELPPFDASSLANWDDEMWSRAILHFQPAVAVVSSPWPVRDLHNAHEVPLEDIDIDLRDRGEHVLIRRHGLAVHCDRIDGNEADALRALFAGETLGVLMQRLADGEQEADIVGTWFARWMSLGMITGITLQ